MKSTFIADLDDLINQTREQQAATLQEVEWRGRKLPVKQEKIRIFLLREQEFTETEVQGKSYPVRNSFRLQLHKNNIP